MLGETESFIDIACAASRQEDGEHPTLINTAYIVLKFQPSEAAPQTPIGAGKHGYPVPLPPNRTMSPLLDARGLSSRNSRERHCDRDVVPPFGGVTFQRLGHFTSTFLLPFAPPRFAARLPRYYESSDFCRAASTDLTGIAKFVPLRRAILHRGPGPLLTQRPPLRILTMGRPRPSPDRSPCLSRLTFRPLHLQPPHCHFVTVALARYFTAVTCRVYPPGQTVQVGGMAVARSRVQTSPGASPTGLAESSSLALRMGRASQVALHLSSRKRSYHGQGVAVGMRVAPHPPAQIRTLRRIVHERNYSSHKSLKRERGVGDPRDASPKRAFDRRGPRSQRESRQQQDLADPHPLARASGFYGFRIHREPRPVVSPASGRGLASSSMRELALQSGFGQECLTYA